MGLPKDWQKMSWHDIGVHAGKTEGWMNLEETLVEDAAEYPVHFEDSGDIVQSLIDDWTDTDHFRLIYQEKMGEAAREKVAAQSAADEDPTWISSPEKVAEFSDAYDEIHSDFWEGYLAGRKAIGIDIYARAKELLSPTKPKPAKKRRSPKRSGSGTTLRGMK
jgi:hypothetical protein